MSGKVIALDQVNDPVFSSRMVGDGYAVEPNDSQVVAPCDGEITVVFPTFHAYGLTTKDGIEILIHLGIDTVKLAGKGFRNFVSVGDNVKAGAVLAEFDYLSVRKEGFDVTSMFIFTSGEKVKLLKENKMVAKNEHGIIEVKQ